MDHLNSIVKSTISTCYPPDRSLANLRTGYSFAPTTIELYRNGRLVDVTRDPANRRFLLSDLHKMQSDAARNGASERAGFLAGFVAQKALMGHWKDGWETMLRKHDPDHGETSICLIDNNTLKRYDLLCPERYRFFRSFPESLALFLYEHKYLTYQQSKQAGFDALLLERKQKDAKAQAMQKFDTENSASRGKEK